MTDRSPQNIIVGYNHGYWHARNGFPKAASGYDYDRGYRDGCIAAANAPAPPHSENDDLSERTTA